MFVEVTGEKQVGGGGGPFCPPASWLGLKHYTGKVNK